MDDIFAAALKTDAPESDAFAGARTSEPAQDDPFAAALKPQAETKPQDDGDQVSRYASRIPPEDPYADQVSRARGKYPQPETPLFKDIAQRNDLYRLADYTASREAIRADVAKRYRIDNGLEGKELSMAQMHEVERLTDEAYKQSKVKQPDQGFAEVAKEAFQAAVADPMTFATEFLKETAANPQWLLPLFGEFGLADAVKGASKAAMATRAVVRAGDAGLMGATIGAGSSAIRQKQEQGEVSGSQLANDALMAGATTAVLQPVVAGAVALAGKIASTRNGTKLTPDNVQKGVADAIKAIEGGMDPEVAVRQVLDEMKVPEAEAAAVAQAVKEAADAVKAAEPKPPEEPPPPPGGTGEETRSQFYERQAQSTDDPVMQAQYREAAAREKAKEDAVAEARKVADSELAPKDPQQGTLFDSLERGTPDASIFIPEGADQAKRVQIIARLNKALELLKKGDEESVVKARAEIENLVRQRNADNQRAAEARDADRVRGEYRVREMLYEGMRQGNISEEGGKLALWFLDQAPHIADSLALTFKKVRGGTGGHYNPADRVVALAKGNIFGDPLTAAHEILHHTERMMPSDIQEGIRNEWVKRLTELQRWGIDNDSEAARLAVSLILRMNAGDMEAKAALERMYHSQLLPNHAYQLFSPSEFWAENGSRILNDRKFAAENGWVAKAKQWTKEFIEKLKGVVGLDSDAPVLRALKNVTEGTGEFQPKARMIADEPQGVGLRKTREGVYAQLEQPKPIWRTSLGTALEKAPFNKDGMLGSQQLKQWLQANAAKHGVPKAEIEWSGLNEYLDMNKKVSLADVKTFLDQNGVKVTEVELNDSVGADAAQKAREVHRAMTAAEDKLTALERRAEDTMYAKSIRDEAKALLPDARNEVARLRAQYERVNAAAQQSIESNTPTKYASYQLPGGKNYRELLLTLPSKDAKAALPTRKQFQLLDATDGSIISAGDAVARERWLATEAVFDGHEIVVEREVPDLNAPTPSGMFRSSHYPDHPNLLAHIRFNERRDAQGNRVLFIEEIQSDWAQKGRKEGFDAPGKGGEVFQQDAGTWGVRWADGSYSGGFSREGAERAAQGNKRGTNIPSAPFVGKTEAWVALALKRMIRYAADNGFDRIAWTNGEQQAARYKLSNTVKTIEVAGRTDARTGEKSRSVSIDMLDGRNVQLGVDPKGVIDNVNGDLPGGRIQGKDLADVIGKDMADKVMQAENGARFEGNGLDVGGKGMKVFYDKIVPNVANDILKKMGGGRVGEVRFGYDESAAAIVQDAGSLQWFHLDANGMMDTSQSWSSAKEARAALPANMTQPGFEITPKMQEKAAQGMPLFQAGKIDQRLLAAMGLGSAGALATWIYTEDPFKASLAGLTGAALTFATAKPVRSVLAAMGVHTDQRWRITDLTDRYSGMIAGGELAHQRMYRALMKNLGPTSDERLKVMRDWMEADPTTPQGQAFRQAHPLSAKEAAFVHAIEVGFDGGGQKLIAIGMDPTKLLENYVSHLWVPGLNTNKSILENLRAGFAERSNDVSPGMSPHSRFSMRRTIPTYAEGERMGLIPVTNNPAAILQIYLNNVNKALANKQLQGALLRERTPWGERLMVVDMPEPALKEVLKRDAITARQLQLDPAEKKLLQDMHASIRAPASYVNIEHPQMKGFKVLSDIAPPLKHLFDARDPNVATKMAYNVSVAAKRALFSWSLFHAKSLLDALLGAGLKLPFKLAAARRALDDAGPAGDALMLGVKQGLRVTGRPIEGDITPFTNALRLLGEKYPVVGAPAKAVNFITQKMDHFLWEYVHPTFKAAAFLAQFEKESTKRPNVPREQIAKEVASYVNDVFGSVDWFRIADGVSNKYGRDLALAVTSPSGRRFMQIAMLAPDWTVATGRSLLKAIPGISSRPIGAMHRAYFVRSALIYATVADALNVAYSGHHFWENEDPTTVDMGDGRRLQLSKHFMEGIHWLTKPGQQALNKLGFVISEPLKQAFNQEYLSTKGAPPIVKTNPNDSAGKQAISAAGQRMLHAAVSPLPITVQNLLSLTPGSAVAGFLGFPVLSKNEEQAVQAARERAEKQGKDVEQAEKRVRKTYQKKQEKQDALR